MRKLFVVCLAASLLQSGAFPADVFVSGPPSALAPLREIAKAWEADTGNEIVWLSGQGAAAAADLIVTDVSMARTLLSDGVLTPIASRTDEGAWIPPPLLHNTLVLGQEGTGRFLALPVRVNLPTLRARGETLSRAGESLPSSPSWQVVFDLAYRVGDPVGNIHGLCAANFGSAILIRSLLSDEGSSWLGGSGGVPYSGPEWAKQAGRLARAMARFGPPNAMSLTRAEMTELLGEGKCALWLAYPGDPVAVGEQVASVPGAAAFASYDVEVIGLVAESQRPWISHSLAWWLSENAIGRHAAEGLAEEVEALSQPGSAESYKSSRSSVPQDWRTVDLAGEEPLRELNDGLVTVTEALAKAVAALADSS